MYIWSCLGNASTMTNVYDEPITTNHHNPNHSQDEEEQDDKLQPQPSSIPHSLNLKCAEMTCTPLQHPQDKHRQQPHGRDRIVKMKLRPTPSLSFEDPPPGGSFDDEHGGVTGTGCGERLRRESLSVKSTSAYQFWMNYAGECSSGKKEASGGGVNQPTQSDPALTTAATSPQSVYSVSSHQEHIQQQNNNKPKSTTTGGPSCLAAPSVKNILERMGVRDETTTENNEGNMQGGDLNLRQVATEDLLSPRVVSCSAEIKGGVFTDRGCQLVTSVKFPSSAGTTMDQVLGQAKDAFHSVYAGSSKAPQQTQTEEEPELHLQESGESTEEEQEPHQQESGESRDDCDGDARTDAFTLPSYNRSTMTSLSERCVGEPSPTYTHDSLMIAKGSTDSGDDIFASLSASTKSWGEGEGGDLRRPTSTRSAATFLSSPSASTYIIPSVKTAASSTFETGRVRLDTCSTLTGGCGGGDENENENHVYKKDEKTTTHTNRSKVSDRVHRILVETVPSSVRSASSAIYSPTFSVSDKVSPVAAAACPARPLSNKSANSAISQKQQEQKQQKQQQQNNNNNHEESSAFPFPDAVSCPTGPLPRRRAKDHELFLVDFDSTGMNKDGDCDNNRNKQAAEKGVVLDAKPKDTCGRSSSKEAHVQKSPSKEACVQKSLTDTTQETMMLTSTGTMEDVTSEESMKCSSTESMEGTEATLNTLVTEPKATAAESIREKETAATQQIAPAVVQEDGWGWAYEVWRHKGLIIRATSGILKECSPLEGSSRNIVKATSSSSNVSGNSALNIVNVSNNTGRRSLPAMSTTMVGKQKDKDDFRSILQRWRIKSSTDECCNPTLAPEDHPVVLWEEHSILLTDQTDHKDNSDAVSVSSEHFSLCPSHTMEVFSPFIPRPPSSPFQKRSPSPSASPANAATPVPTPPNNPPPFSAKKKPPLPKTPKSKKKKSIDKIVAADPAPFKDETARVANQLNAKKPKQRPASQKSKSSTSPMKEEVTPSEEPVTQVLKIKERKSGESLLVLPHVQIQRRNKNLPKSNGDYKSIVQVFLKGVEKNDFELLKSFSDKSEEEEKNRSSTRNKSTTTAVLASMFESPADNATKSPEDQQKNPSRDMRLEQGQKVPEQNQPSEESRTADLGTKSTASPDLTCNRNSIEPNHRNTTPERKSSRQYREMVERAALRGSARRQSKYMPFEDAVNDRHLDDPQTSTNAAVNMGKRDCEQNLSTPGCESQQKPGSLETKPLSGSARRQFQGKQSQNATNEFGATGEPFDTRQASSEGRVNFAPSILDNKWGDECNQRTPGRRRARSVERQGLLGGSERGGRAKSVERENWSGSERIQSLFKKFRDAVTEREASDSEPLEEPRSTIAGGVNTASAISDSKRDIESSTRTPERRESRERSVSVERRRSHFQKIREAVNESEAGDSEPVDEPITTIEGVKNTSPVLGTQDFERIWSTSERRESQVKSVSAEREGLSGPGRRQSRSMQLQDATGPRRFSKPFDEPPASSARVNTASPTFDKSDIDLNRNTPERYESRQLQGFSERRVLSGIVRPWSLPQSKKPRDAVNEREARESEPNDKPLVSSAGVNTETPVWGKLDFDTSRSTPIRRENRTKSASAEREGLRGSARYQSQSRREPLNHPETSEPVSSKKKDLSSQSMFRNQKAPRKESDSGLPREGTLVGKTIEVRSASKRKANASLNESADSGAWVKLLSQDTTGTDTEEEDSGDAVVLTSTNRIKEEARSQPHPWRRDMAIRQANSFEGDFAIRSFEETQPCQCASSVFSGRDELVEFYLPLMGMACVCGARSTSTSLPNPDEPTALENILRPWQVEYLGSFGVYKGDQLVKAYHRSGPALAKAMRRYRKKHGMTPFRTKSCGMALGIWAKTCKAFVRSIRKQLTSGVSDGVKMPNTLYILSSFLEKIPMEGSTNSIPRIEGIASMGIGSSMTSTTGRSEECSL